MSATNPIDRLSESTKQRIRLGYSKQHNKFITDEALSNLTYPEARLYMRTASEANTADKPRSKKWIIGVVATLFVLIGLTSSGDTTPKPEQTKNAAAVSQPQADTTKQADASSTAQSATPAPAVPAPAPTPPPVTAPKPAPTPAPVPKPAPVASAVPKPASNCDPNYSGCVPNVSYDLDCPDIGFSVRVIGTDHHRFDGDKNGLGCESYN